MLRERPKTKLTNYFGLLRDNTRKKIAFRLLECEGIVDNGHGISGRCSHHGSGDTAPELHRSAVGTSCRRDPRGLER